MTLVLPNVLGRHTLAILGVKELASGCAAILGFTMPIWTVLLGVLVIKEKLARRIGLAVLAVALAIGLLTFNEVTALAGRPLGIVWMELAALSWHGAPPAARDQRHERHGHPAGRHRECQPD